MSLPGVGKVYNCVAASTRVPTRPEAVQPSIRPIGKAEATRRLFAQAVNLLALPGSRLNAALAIEKGHAFFERGSAGLAATCTLVKATCGS